MDLKLNPQQRLAAEDREHNLLVLAGAGTGKTLTLAARVAGLLTGGAAQPEQVLCLTFTNRACKEMRQRIAALAGQPAAQVQIRTIHSFCGWLLRQAPAALTDIGPDFTVCDEASCLEAVREVVFQSTGREIEERPARILQQFLELCKDCLLLAGSSDPFRGASLAFSTRQKALERICTTPQRRFDPKFFAFLQKYGGSILQLYNLKLTQANQLDFSDLLLRAALLMEDPAFDHLWRGRWRFVQVDEVQDVSLGEYRLVSRLCQGARVLFCGDFNQTIYQWRGSDPAALLARYREEFAPVEVRLDHNYRSDPQLLALAQRFLCRAFGQGQAPQAPLGQRVQLREFETAEEEARWLARSISQLPTQDYSRVAVITRTNRACAQLCELLKQLRLEGEGPVRFMLADQARLFRRAEVRDLVACLGLLYNPRDQESCRRVLTRLAAGIGPAAVNGVLSCWRAGGGAALCDFLDPRLYRAGDYFAPLLQALEAGEVVVFDVETTGTDVYADEIVQLAAVRLGPDGQVTGRFEAFLRPSRPVGDSQQVHGFSDAFLAQRGQAPLPALEGFLEFAGEAVLVGHNVGFDVEITGENLRRLGYGGRFSPLWYDTLDLSRRFLPKLPDHKLATVAQALEAQHAPSHNAMDDILATAQVLWKLCEGYLRPRAAQRLDCYKKFMSRFLPFCRQWEGLRAACAGQAAWEAAQYLCQAFGLPGRCETGEQQANLLLFTDLARELVDPGLPPRQQLARLLELCALTAGEFDQLAQAGNKVAVITAHQAKGCEFDYVYLPVLQEGVFPTYQAVQAGDLEEEKRVFYVSLTRAKKQLFLSWAHQQPNRYPAQPSRFLSLLWP